MKLNQVPTTGFWGWFHHHWIVVMSAFWFAVGLLAGLKFTAIASYFIYGRAL